MWRTDEIKKTLLDKIIILEGVEPGTRARTRRDTASGLTPGNLVFQLWVGLQSDRERESTCLTQGSTVERASLGRTAMTAPTVAENASGWRKQNLVFITTVSFLALIINFCVFFNILFQCHF